MITYPSTHGVFEEGIRDICAIVHEHGGQVYLDGANLNALVGICRPAELGADVCPSEPAQDLLHPARRRRPGHGPDRRQGAPRALPAGPPVVSGATSGGRDGTVGQVSAAPWGSAVDPADLLGLYRDDGRHGLTRATEVAILNANYIAAGSRRTYPIVYTGPGGHVAHECIVDLRQIKEPTGITAEDVAKRLIDYGFHAPTMSWPVPETLMIEPTESED